MKKLLSVVLALLMLAVMLPVTAMADDANYCTIEGVNGKFDTLTAAAKAWRESKGVVTEGNTFGANNLGTVESTVESIVWDIFLLAMALVLQVTMAQENVSLLAVTLRLLLL